MLSYSVAFYFWAVPPQKKSRGVGRTSLLLVQGAENPSCATAIKYWMDSPILPI